MRLGLRTLAAAEVLDGLADGDVVLLGAGPLPGTRVRADSRADPAVATAPRGAATSDGAATLTNAMGR